MNIIQKAERLPNGRVKGVAPPQLWPKVARRLSQEERLRLETIREEQVAVNRKMLRFFEEMGLDPRKPYRFTKDGDVIEVGKHVARY